MTAFHMLYRCARGHDAPSVNDIGLCHWHACAECGHASHPPRGCAVCGCLWGLPVPGHGLPGGAA